MRKFHVAFISFLHKPLPIKRCYVILVLKVSFPIQYGTFYTQYIISPFQLDTDINLPTISFLSSIETQFISLSSMVSSTTIPIFFGCFAALFVLRCHGNLLSCINIYFFFTFMSSFFDYSLSSRSLFLIFIILFLYIFVYPNFFRFCTVLHVYPL
jgi:hypothetical protein